MSKSLIDRIGMSTHRCGLCCSKNYPCNKCIESTLKANELPLTLKKELQGLSHKDDSHAWAEYSPFVVRLRALIAKQFQKRKQR